MILRALVSLRDHGLTDEAVYQMTVTNPARMLDIPDEKDCPDDRLEAVRRERA